MDTLNIDPGNMDPGSQPRRPRWSGRTRRIVTTSAASAVLLASGTAIGVALTGGASAAVSPTSSSTPAASTSSTSTGTTSPGSKASRCAAIVSQAQASNHDRLARALRAFCSSPLVRLALVGGEHGTVTFGGKAGPRTLAFERGTVKSDNNGSQITVTAADGTTWTWDITSSTVIRQAGSKVTASALSTGERVFVGGMVVSGANDARLIRIAKSS
jgi:hypothetical protein